MQQKFNLEAAGRLLGISASAMRARAKKSPEKYRLERDNRGQIWVWIDLETLPDLKPLMHPAKGVALQAQSDELKAVVLAVHDRDEAAVIRADLQSQIEVLRTKIAEAQLKTAVAQALADERARALEAAERNLADLRRLLPAPPGPSSARPWWQFWT